MSLVTAPDLTLDMLHVHLSEMPVYSPIFYICDNIYTLSLLLHDADYYHQVSVTYHQSPVSQKSPNVTTDSNNMGHYFWVTL